MNYSIADYYDDSDDDSDDGANFDRYDDIISHYFSEGLDSDNADNAWTYLFRSVRGSTVYGNLGKKSLPDSGFKLTYNHTDQMLLTKARAEAKQSLDRARRKLNLSKDSPFDAAEAFAAVCPRLFLEKFHEYLMTALGEEETATWSFVDIGCFLRCEVLMRLFSISETELKDFGVNSDVSVHYQRVRKALTKADKPASSRKVIDGAAQLPACSFDPIIQEAIDILNKHWIWLFYVEGLSWGDLDDDKIANCSPLWKLFGWKMTPTKDKKLKPVNHLMALIGAGYITHIAPDLLDLKLGDMLRKTIETVCPSKQPARRASLAFFIDRGYLELCQAQRLKVTNLIQIMDEMGVKFLGTIKNSESFPFQIVDLNESGNPLVNGKPVVQGYGTRTSFSARKGNKVATVMRHGAGKIRAARAATNLVECREDTWVYETDSLMKRTPHVSSPLPLRENATIDQQVEHAWQTFLSSIVVLTILQRTADWFLARYFRFTSTTFHVVINVKAAVYINTKHLKELHSRILDIVCLRPRKTVTVDNARELDDEDLPAQRSHQTRTEGEGERGTNIGDVKCSVEYWLKGKDVNALTKECDDNEIPYDKHATTGKVTTTKRAMADRLAKKFQNEWHEKMAELLNTDVLDEDIESNQYAAVAFLQRLVPHWFMRPFSSRAGGAIEQGTQNEDQVIRVLNKSLKGLSGGQYAIHGRVREFGLVAKKDHPYCTSSPDGVFALKKRNSEGKYDFVALCVLEMKTKGTENTTDQLIRSVLSGGSWGECVTGTAEFESAVPDNAYRTQLCQHATALGLEHVLMVYSLPGAQIKKIILVHVSSEHQQDLLKFQSIVAPKYMPFAYVDNALREIPSLGNDFSKAYGYAQEHYTLELYLQLWLAHSKDVMELGTPPSCRRIIDIVFSFWNKCMGNVDTVRKVVKSRRAKRCPNSGPGSLTWFELFGYILYDGFRLYQHAKIEHKLDTFETFKQFQKTRQDITYTSFLFKLGNGTCFDEDTLKKHYPGLTEIINHAGDPNVVAKVVPANNEDVLDNLVPKKTKGQYNRIEGFLTPGSELYNKRLDRSLLHLSANLPKYQRFRCIVCCEKCINGRCNPIGSATVTNTNANNPSDDNTDVDNNESDEASKKERGASRLGRKTGKFCITCEAVLCIHCHAHFHTEQVPLPKCSPYRALIPRNSRNVVTPAAATATLLTATRSVLPRTTPNPSTTPASRNVVSVNATTTAARGATEANITSPNRMQRQKRMRNSRKRGEQNNSAPTPTNLDHRLHMVSNPPSESENDPPAPIRRSLRTLRSLLGRRT